jgi:hypothetical protein
MNQIAAAIIILAGATLMGNPRDSYESFGNFLVVAGSLLFIVPFSATSFGGITRWIKGE